MSQKSDKSENRQKKNTSISRINEKYYKDSINFGSMSS